MEFILQSINTEYFINIREATSLFGLYRGGEPISPIKESVKLEKKYQNKGAIRLKSK